LLPAKKPAGYDANHPEWREPELHIKRMGFRPQPSFKLYTTGSVGSQILLGLPMLARLRRRFGNELSVWPFEPATRRIVLAETYPSMFPLTVPHPIKDASQVLSTVRAINPAMLAAPRVTEEGWILGAGVVG
jgi:molybdopterin molybdotransferase